MATIFDVARMSKVSIGTVSNVLNNPEKVKTETRQRVLEVIKALNFHPNLSARNLSRLRTDTIALIFPFSKRNRMEPYYTYLLAGITEICFQMNFKLLLSSCTTNINEKEELSIYAEYVESQAVDGLIVTTPKSCDERIKFLVETKQNFVVLGRSNISLDFPWVDIDGSYGMSEAVRYLSTLGHKRIGYIGTPNIFMFSRHRLEGYERGLNNCNIEFDPELVVEVSINEDEVEAGEKGILQLLRLNLPPKAVIVSGNQLALGVIKGINKFGYAVGKDISLICFDDAEWNVHFNPPITSIRQPIYETGKMLSKILIQQIKGVKIKDSHILLKPELIIRESCKKYG